MVHTGPGVCTCGVDLELRRLKGDGRAGGQVLLVVEHGSRGISIYTRFGRETHIEGVDRGDHHHDRGFADRKVTLEDEELRVLRSEFWKCRQITAHVL